LLGKFEVSQISPFLLLLPVFTVIAEALFLDEKMGIIIYIGGIIIILGVATITVERLPAWLVDEV